MAGPPPAAATTLVVILGASEYPRDPKLSNPRFRRSADALRRYFEDPAGFGLPADNLLWLFDSADAPSQLDEKIRDFLKRARLRDEPRRPRDVILYYVGHGFFDDDKAYFLAIRGLTPDAPDSNYRFKALQRSIRTEARHARKFLILDACFSGAASRELMSLNVEAKRVVDEASAEAKDDLPGKGTALLCAASRDDVARAPDNDEHTMFSGALLAVLDSPESGAPRLSLRQAGELAYDIIRDRFASDAVRPEVHSPDQKDGDIAGIGLFPLRGRAVTAGAFSATVLAEGIHDAFDPATFATDAAIHCVVVSPERDLGDQTTPLAQHVRRAWDYFGAEITAAANHYRAGRRLAPVPSPDDGSEFVLADLSVTRAFASEGSLSRAIEALCRAELAVFDLTGFEPGVLLLLGIRAVARRGVTLSSVGGDYTIGGELAVPFNLQLLNLSAHSTEQESESAGLRPWDLIGDKIQNGYHDLANLPHYLDLPAYESVRQLGVESGAYKPIRYSDKVLVLCPFSNEYTKRNWKRFLEAELPGKLKQRIRKAGGPPDARPPRLERLLDLKTPRLVAQTLFESIRLTDMCVIDWTDLRPNVMFEAGVRLATNPLGAVHIVELTQDGTLRVSPGSPAQTEGMTRMFAPIGYRCKPGDTAAYGDMITRFETSLAANRDGHAGFIYRAVGQALDRRSHPAAVPLVEELIRDANILESDDQESTGISPVLYHEVNKDLVAEAREAAAERRLAAWLFMSRRYSAKEIAGDAHRLEQFELLSIQARRWARKEGKPDLIEAIRTSQQAVAAVTTFNAEAEIAKLNSRVKLRKEEAKDFRDAGDVPAAVDALAEAVAILESSPLYPGLEGTDTATAAHKTLAGHLADCLGMMGGNYRRLTRLDDALTSFKRGRVYEDAERLDVNSSYNLVNAIALPIEMGRKSAEQQDALRRAVTAIDRQLKGERRNDRWAWADLGQCQLLLGQVDDAKKSYQRVCDLGDDETVKSVVAVLQRLLRAVEQSEQNVATSLREGIRTLER